jgi:hypothetical protein
MDTTPQKLADWLQDKTIYLWDSGDEQYYASPICEDIVPMLRQQQAEIEALKKQLEPDPNICNYCGFFKGCCTCPTWSNQK